ncbi:Protein Red [Geodia barretti]|uniref:Protein Red n=4 Tax=Geodia barretti TaxID=519541 RepID=A0AA35SZG8_GEOBA|nr:Protein Red [Geodia barretti]
MPEILPEAYSNPIAPPDGDVGEKRNLSNDDFRRLMMTPRVSTSSSGASAMETPVSAKKPAPSGHKTRSASTSSIGKSSSHGGSADKTMKKTLYAKMKKEEEEREAEWAKKYRDRAKERREGANPDYTGVEDPAPTNSGYRAVAPNVDPKVQEEQRKKEIQESKYLGGDMEHTHLVKGLDYSLLQKVRSELTYREQQEEEMYLLEKKMEKERSKAEALQEDITFKTKMAKGVYRTLFLSKPPEKNEHFFPGRMAYVFELDDEYAESDIPTTLIRSKADCPTVEVTTLTTNDIVINKLTQILSYLRQGARSGKKGRKRDRGPAGKGLLTRDELPAEPPKEDSIYPNVGEYVFDPKSAQPKAAMGAGAVSGAQPTTNYFGKSALEDNEGVTAKAIKRETEQFVRAVAQRFPGQEAPPTLGESPWASAKQQQQQQPDQSSRTGRVAPAISDSGPTKRGATSSGASNSGFGGLLEGHYAECYPGMAEEYDATYDSDDEADYTKMDMGNKKGPVKRWDFETEEEYSSYQSGREAMPKAAFQYGVKMNDGRKTRRFGGLSDKAREKAKLNREWQQISQIIDKRKNKPSAESAAKKQRLE